MTLCELKWHMHVFINCVPLSMLCADHIYYAMISKHDSVM